MTNYRYTCEQIWEFYLPGNVLKNIVIFLLFFVVNDENDNNLTDKFATYKITYILLILTLQPYLCIIYL